MSHPSGLFVENATFAYTPGTLALSAVSFHVLPGSIVGLVGPNGSGKSTLIKLVFDLLEPQGGAVSIAGADRRTLEAKTRSIYLPSEDVVPAFLTGEEYVDLVQSMYGAPRVGRDVLRDGFAELGMRGRERHLIEDYSHGMRKKVQLLAALHLAPSVVVIDETLNGIDRHALRRVEQKLLDLRDEGRAILLCTHDIGVLERVADRVLVLSDGILVDELEVSAVGAARLAEVVDEGLAESPEPR